MKIYQLGHVDENEYSTIGGKAKGLDLLTKHNFNVPKGFVITDIDVIDDESVYKAFDALGSHFVSVRSSANGEDGDENSNAGQFETYIFVEREQLIGKIKLCMASLYSHRVGAYAKHFNIKQSNKMNIVVQEMIHSKKAGVMFTSSPTNGSCVLIEAVKDQGENLVSGKTSAHRYEISKKQYFDCSDDLLTSDELKRLYDISKKIKDEFNQEMDVEWAIDGDLYLLQMRPITTDVIDLEEFDRDEDLSTHLFTKRNVGEMMPGAVTPLTLSTSTKAIDYGMRYMLTKAGLFKKPEDEEPLHMISSFSGHLFFDMNLLYNLHSAVMIANPQSMNLSIMGEYHDYPKIEKKYRSPIVRIINSIRFLHYVLSGKKAMKGFDKVIAKVHFDEGGCAKDLYKSIDENLKYLDESLIYHYASSSYSGSATSTLYMMVDKYFPDKKKYQAFLSKILSNIPNIESADILYQLQNISSIIKEKNPKALQYSEQELLAYIKQDSIINTLYQQFLMRHGHRCIKEAEMRNKPWREDELSLMAYFKSVLHSPMSLTQKESTLNLKEEFNFVKNPLLKKACISYAKKSRQAVVSREYTKSQLIKIIDMFKTQYRILAKKMVEEKLLDDEDQIYFFLHEEIAEVLKGDEIWKKKANTRRQVLKLQEEINFDDIYIGKPVPNQIKMDDGQIKGVPISVGECDGIVRIVRNIEDANKLQKGEIMVAKFTDIGWTPYYSIVNGLVTEIGSSLSHGAVVAREYGLPTVVNVSGATVKLKTGDHIHLDATKGIITIIEK